MSDIESDRENRPLSTTQASNAMSPTPSDSIKEEYRVQQLENLLKMSADSKQSGITWIYHLMCFLWINLSKEEKKFLIILEPGEHEQILGRWRLGRPSKRGRISRPDSCRTVNEHLKKLMAFPRYIILCPQQCHISRNLEMRPNLRRGMRRLLREA